PHRAIELHDLRRAVLDTNEDGVERVARSRECGCRARAAEYTNQQVEDVVGAVSNDHLRLGDSMDGGDLPPQGLAGRIRVKAERAAVVADFISNGGRYARARW